MTSDRREPSDSPAPPETIIETGHFTKWTPAPPTFSDAELAREACAALSRATWFAEYLERRFTALRADEFERTRERCAQLAESYTLGEVGGKVAQTIAQKIRELSSASPEDKK